MLIQKDKNKFDVTIPLYILTQGPVVLDGDIYKFLGYKTVAAFRKDLKRDFFQFKDYCYQISLLDRYLIKQDDPDCPWIKTSSHTFAFHLNSFECRSFLMELDLRS